MTSQLIGVSGNNVFTICASGVEATEINLFNARISGANEADPEGAFLTCLTNAPGPQANSLPPTLQEIFFDKQI